eukprot:CAMPEP_0174261334 /NCGR_PEP_ID=MMETSP0439-20130205/11369_1 /TAXON_ID=0 /ORGANISM="Stereomyxa ramosa, Strain Chinc5" /LENGTH=290 /DNA_ID=CAMNT_0015345791 /DNA_START=20 /DNA_END=892 /DNA_ORIENTATION=+
MPSKQPTVKRVMPHRAAHDKKLYEGGVFGDLPVKRQRIRKKIPAPKKRTPRSKRVKRKTHPTYGVMILKAISALKRRGGCSLFAICKHLEEEYPLSDNYRRYVTSAIRKALEDGLLEQNRRSYKLTDRGKTQANPRRKKRKSKSKSKSSSQKKKVTKKRARSKSPRASKGSKAKGKGKATPRKRAPPKSRAKAKPRGGSASAGKKKTTTPKGFSFVWQYQDNGWKNYEINASDVVEEAYQDYLKNPAMCDVRAVSSGQWQYQVDFTNMKQTNIQHENHTTRSIRRMVYNV